MSPPAASPPGPFTLLVVGAENVRRSPLAERVAEAYLTDVLGERSTDTFRVSSAGTQAAPGATMDENSALVLRGLGGEPERFWAQRLSPNLVTVADLVLTTTRDEREDVLALAPRALGRTFTLLEAAELVAQLDVSETHLPERVRGVVRAMATARSGRRSSEADDLADPAGRSVRVHQEVGETVADATLRVVGRLLGEPDRDRPRPRRAADVSGRGWRRWHER
jgi:protein-tyrosine phosphatase